MLSRKKRQHFEEKGCRDIKRQHIGAIYESEKRRLKVKQQIVLKQHKTGKRQYFE